MIISISGFIGSGKDTVAAYLVSNYGFTSFSFASTVKDVLSVVFGWDRALLEGDTPESRLWRTEVDLWWEKRLNIPNFTPRFALQNIGTDVFRTHFHNEIWIAALEQKLQKCTTDIVVTDCRFVNERESLLKQYATMVQVKRGEIPAWGPTGISAAKGSPVAISIMEKLGIHRSEWEWLTTDFPVVLDNNTTMENLYQQIDRMIVNTK